mmetsp:Transcript_116769/g.203116  ORF Transcript_116769/g.203116 Transcript_116769/m.203116 type:complete len:298 (-) Transcript_116769:1654-2547(-)
MRMARKPTSTTKRSGARSRSCWTRMIASPLSPAPPMAQSLPSPSAACLCCRTCIRGSSLLGTSAGAALGWTAPARSFSGSLQALLWCQVLSAPPYLSTPCWCTHTLLASRRCLSPWNWSSTRARATWTRQRLLSGVRPPKCCVKLLPCPPQQPLARRGVPPSTPLFWNTSGSGIMMTLLLGCGKVAKDRTVTITTQISPSMVLTTKNGCTTWMKTRGRRIPSRCWGTRRVICLSELPLGSATLSWMTLSVRSGFLALTSSPHQCSRLKAGAAPVREKRHSRSPVPRATRAARQRIRR